MAKEGRELWQVMPSEEFEEINGKKVKNIKIHKPLEKIDLINYLTVNYEIEKLPISLERSLAP